MRRPPTSRSALRTLLFAVALLSGCKPDCESACEKLVACEEPGTERMGAGECEEQCKEQEERYATWTDEQLRDRFDAHLECLETSTCDDVFAGACYDEELFSF